MIEEQNERIKESKGWGVKERDKGSNLKVEKERFQ
jgi:hypothetical protein